MPPDRTLIATADDALFTRYWRDQFRRLREAAGKGLCFRLLTTGARRTVMEACKAAEDQLQQQLDDYERRQRRP